MIAVDTLVPAHVKDKNQRVSVRQNGWAFPFAVNRGDVLAGKVIVNLILTDWEMHCDTGSWNALYVVFKVLDNYLNEQYNRMLFGLINSTVIFWHIKAL